jgi:hypothetical protein
MPSQCQIEVCLQEIHRIAFLYSRLASESTAFPLQCSSMKPTNGHRKKAKQSQMMLPIKKRLHNQPKP